ncbi:MAG: FkbM family methyltransferase [Nitrospinota bacterium]|nr:FkbM family methyltransferase [Nitrospinota bacterium]
MSNFSILDVLSGPPPLISVVDIGAMAEGGNRFDKLLDLGITKVVGFEPQPDELAKLKAKDDARHTYLNYFVGRGGPATFHTCRYRGCSSLYRPDPRIIDPFIGVGTVPGSNFEVLSSRGVKTKQLDDIREIEACDYLLIDVQGSELDVLEGARRTLRNTPVVEVEVEFVPLYEGQPLFAEIDVFMRENGFLLHKLIDVAGRAFRPFLLGDQPDDLAKPLSQLLWADAVFVKDFTRFDEVTSGQLLKTAIVLHEVYLSPDLASRALDAYDRKEGSGLCKTYVERFFGGEGFETNFINIKDWM